MNIASPLTSPCRNLILANTATVWMPQDKVSISNAIVGSSQTDIVFLVVAVGVNDLKMTISRTSRVAGMFHLVNVQDVK